MVIENNLINIGGIHILILSLIVYFTGTYITNKFNVLDRFHIPVGVIGGIPAAIIFSCIEQYSGYTFVFETALRDFILLFFFCTTGMLANLSELSKGGALLIKLIFTIVIFLICQNTVGVLAAWFLDVDLVDGLIIGSITLAGGHGTAISWGSHLVDLGFTDALDIGLISATLGLVSGALIGGIVSKKLIHKTPTIDHEALQNDAYEFSSTENIIKIASSTPLFLKTILFILIIMLTGKEFNKILAYYNIISPDYLPTMIFAIVFVTLGNNFTKTYTEKNKILLLNNVSLQVFIAMTMMSVNAAYIVHSQILIVLFILSLQVLFIIFFAKFIFFRIAGRDYDAAALTAGFIGTGLGATPVGLANIETITKKYGPSIKAFLLLPLLGSVFTDSLNAIIINLYLSYLI